jgi:hypothetical protein
MDSKAMLTRFGFKFNKGGTHTGRTMMLDELSLLLSYVNDPDASRADYISAIVEDNCLAKRSVQNRKLTAKYLTELYALNLEFPIFRVLLYFWKRDEEARPLLALLCAFARDPLLRMSMPFIFNHREGRIVSRVHLEEYIEERFPGRFSKNTLSSVAQNINATWTQSGHLKGRSKKIRAKARATPGAVAYAFFLAYLTGGRGKTLLHTEYARLLDSREDILLDLASGASRRGWIIFNRVADVLEIRFPNQLTTTEVGWVHEQNQSLT